MSIDSFKAIISPPEQPVEAGAIDWKGLEKEYGTKFPDDYMELVSNYGSGLLDGFVWILNPNCSNDNLNFEKSKYFLNSIDLALIAYLI